MFGEAITLFFKETVPVSSFAAVARIADRGLLSGVDGVNHSARLTFKDIHLLLLQV